VNEAGWQYACRTSKSTTATWEEATLTLNELGSCLKPGRLIELKDVAFTQDA
jgi:phage tail protein X